MRSDSVRTENIAEMPIIGKGGGRKVNTEYIFKLIRFSRPLIHSEEEERNKTLLSRAQANQISVSRCLPLQTRPFYLCKVSLKHLGSNFGRKPRRFSLRRLRCHKTPQ